MGSISRWEGNKCPICGKEHIKTNPCGRAFSENWYHCPRCGEYFADKRWYFSGFLGLEAGNSKNYDEKKLKSYLFYHKGGLRPYLVSEESFVELDKSDFVEIYNLTPDMVETWYPKTFSERVDKILLYLASQTEYMGQELNLEYQDIASIYFIEHEAVERGQDSIPSEITRQIDYIDKYFREAGLLSFSNQGYVDSLQWKQGSYLTITPKGWARIDELQKSIVRNKNIFVSMAFNDDTKTTREAIRRGIIKAEHSPEFLDEIIHNRQIVPEMFRLIRECRFLILEISDPNYGAYYEAGYALGLGKEVIVCCSRKVFDGTEYGCEKDRGNNEKCKYIRKALKPHFDILQKQILVWDDYDDLTKKLEEWIRELSTRN